jgi:hypothetical protein
LPLANGMFRFDDGMPGNSPPMLAGGDPSGEWAVTGITLFLPSVAMSLVNVESSSLSGSAWLDLGSDGTFQMTFDMDVDVRIGEGESESSFAMGNLLAGAIGTYSVSGSSVMIADDCFYNEGLDMFGSASSGAGISREFSFERSGTTGRFIVTLQADLGDLPLLVEVRAL